MYNPDVRIDCFAQQGVLDLANPQLKDIHWPSIASSLSRIPRYNGNTGHIGAYSVAQHCTIGADAIFAETGNPFIAGCFLLHDAHEAFVGDITTPVANYFSHMLGNDFTTTLVCFKNIWSKTILSSANINLDEAAAVEDIVNDMDARMLAMECLYFFPEQAYRFHSIKRIPMKGTLKCAGAASAELTYLDRLSRYLGIEERP